MLTFWLTVRFRVCRNAKRVSRSDIVSARRSCSRKQPPTKTFAISRQESVQNRCMLNHFIESVHKRKNAIAPMCVTRMSEYEGRTHIFPAVTWYYQ
ncbi:hypothetical protein Plhal304r1_c042g0121071 [Plasmopara halstedii]